MPLLVSAMSKDKTEWLTLHLGMVFNIPGSGYFLLSQSAAGSRDGSEDSYALVGPLFGDGEDPCYVAAERDAEAVYSRLIGAPPVVRIGDGQGPDLEYLPPDVRVGGSDED